MKNLLIVESFSKCKTIQSYLSDQWDVCASGGHITELPLKTLGIDLQTYQPEYTIIHGKKKILDQLKKQAKTHHIYLATDPDYEGSKIADELAKHLKLNNPTRIIFNEITRNAITSAIENPQKINKNHVNAQTCRRVLDRLIGYQLSPVLQKATGISTASVGRCISVVTRLISDREVEIQNHVYRFSYQCFGNFLIKNHLFKSMLNKSFDTKEDTIQFIETLDNTYNLDNIHEKQITQSPPPPFITSTIQQAGFSKLGFSVKKTTELLQSMYQNGWITYIRTDSRNISLSFYNHLKKYLDSQNYHFQKRVYKNAKHSQEAHECIRPTDLYQNINVMNIDEQKLYQMIWKQTVASQMDDAIILKQLFEISTNTSYVFKGEQEKIISPGWKKIYNTDTSTTFQPLENPPMLQSITCCQVYSVPPKRYSQSTLVKTLEELGIGRPSTYSTILSSIQKKKYIYEGNAQPIELNQEIIKFDTQNITCSIDKITLKDEKKYMITSLGKTCTDILVKEFPEIMNYQFTSMIEDEMELIAQGQIDWYQVVKKFHNLFKDKLETPLHMTMEPKQLGTYNDVLVQIVYTRYGPAIQMGKKYRDIADINITLEDAIQLINQYPKSIGYYKNCHIQLFKGPYGEYFKYNGKNYGLKYVKNITLKECIKIIDKKS